MLQNILLICVIIMKMCYTNELKNPERVPKNICKQLILKVNITIFKTKTYKDAFAKVSSGEVYSTISNLPMASYYITKYGFSNLKIAGHAQNNLRFSMAINNEDKLLTSILNKSLSSITQREKSTIFNRWAHINDSKQINYSMIIYISIFVSFIIILLIYRQFILSKNRDME